MSTNIESLPLLQANIGVGADEDLVVALGFYLADGVTPLALTGINFSATIKSAGPTIATLSTGGGQIVVSGASSNLLTITVFAAAKAAWAPAAYAIGLVASDGTFTRDVFNSSSTVTIGAPAPLSVSVIRPAGAATVNVASAVPPIATAAIQAIVAAYLVGLPTAEPGSNGKLWLNGGVLQVS